jgi:hypothetical protein
MKVTTASDGEVDSKAMKFKAELSDARAELAKTKGELAEANTQVGEFVGGLGMIYMGKEEGV